jgi:hypothetical protein
VFVASSTDLEGNSVNPEERLAKSHEGLAEEQAIEALYRDAKQRLGTLPETPGVIILMSGVSATGSTRLSFYAMNTSALASLDAASPCRIVVTVGLADADGAELDSSEHTFEPKSRNGQAIPFAFEKNDEFYNFNYSAFPAMVDFRISPGMRTKTWPGFVIGTSWTGDVYADIETEKLPQLKSVKLSVKWSGPNSGKADAFQGMEEHAKENLKLANAPLPQPSSAPRGERTANSETEELPASTDSQASPVRTAQSVEGRSAEPTVIPTIDPPQSQVNGRLMVRDTRKHDNDCSRSRILRV